MKAILLSCIVATWGLVACGGDVEVKDPHDAHADDHAEHAADKAADKADDAADKAEHAADKADDAKHD